MCFISRCFSFLHNGCVARRIYTLKSNAKYSFKFSGDQWGVICIRLPQTTDSVLADMVRVFASAVKEPHDGRAVIEPGLLQNQSHWFFFLNLFL